MYYETNEIELILLKFKNPESNGQAFQPKMFVHKFSAVKVEYFWKRTKVKLWMVNYVVFYNLHKNRAFW